MKYLVYLVTFLALQLYSPSCSKKGGGGGGEVAGPVTPETAEPSSEEEVEYSVPNVRTITQAQTKDLPKGLVTLSLNRPLLSEIRVTLDGEELAISAGSQSASFSTEKVLGKTLTFEISQQPSIPSGLNCSLSSAALTFSGDPIQVICPEVQNLSIETVGPYRAGLEYQLMSIALYSNGQSILSTDACVWQSSDVGIIAVANSSFTAVSAGTAILQAQCDGFTATRSITVTAPTIQSLSIHPSTSDLVTGNLHSLQLLAQYDDGSVADVGSSANWASQDPSVASINGSLLLQAIGSGATIITASFQGLTASHNTSVRSANISALEVSPAIWNGTQDGFRQFYSTAVYDDGTHNDVGALVVWSSSDSSIATVDSEGRVTLTGVGDASITATIGEHSATSLVKSENDPVVSISIKPDINTAPLGIDVAFSAEATLQSGTTTDITNEVFWSSSDTNTATLSNSSLTKGLMSSLSAGQVDISLNYGASIYQKTINIQSIDLSSISIEPSGFLLAKGSDQQYTATASFSDSSEFDVTNQVLWSVSGSDTNISNAAGSEGFLTNNFSGSSATTSTVSASLNGVIANSNLILTPNSLTGLIITPDQGQLQIGQSYDLKAYGTYDDGGAIDLTNYVTWNSSDLNSVVVSNSSIDAGRISALGEGSATVTAHYSGLSASSSITSSSAENSFAPSGVGLKGEYFGDKVLGESNYKGSRIDAQVLFNWDRGLAPLGVGDNFSVRWTGQIQAKTSESYTFWMRSDDGIRLWVNDVLVVENWTLHAPRYDVATVDLELVAGQLYNIKIEFFENGGHAVAELYWETPTIAREAVEQQYLYPTP